MSAVVFTCDWIECGSEIIEKTQTAILEETINDSEKILIRKKAYKLIHLKVMVF